MGDSYLIACFAERLFHDGADIRVIFSAEDAEASFLRRPCLAQVNSEARVHLSQKHGPRNGVLVTRITSEWYR